jgi:DNA-binding transcriptional LysR family regulator
VALFERDGRTVRPSEAGKLLLAEIPHVLAAENALRERMEAFRGMEQGSLLIATIDAVSIYVLPEIYLQFRLAHPGIDLRVQVTDSTHVLRAVRDLDAEIGFLALPPGTSRRDDAADLEFHPIFTDNMICVAAPDHPLGRRRKVRLQEVADSPLVLYDRSSTTRAILDTVFDRAGVQPNVAMETASPEAMKRLVEVGMGIAILPEALVAGDLRSGTLSHIPLTDATFERVLAVVLRRDRHLGPATQDFLQRVRQRFPTSGLADRQSKKPRR